MSSQVEKALSEREITALVFAAARDDRAALEEFVRVTQPELRRYVMHLAGGVLVDDLAQETYVRALRSLSAFTGRSSARTWLLSIARRVVTDQIRRAVVRPIGSRADEDRGVPGFEELVEAKMLLAGLPVERRDALMLTQLLGMAYEEVADAIGCPVGTVRSRVARARADLKRAVNAPLADAGLRGG